VIGKQLGNYRILEEVGSGGVGKVYRATDLLLERPVAIKALRADLAERDGALERFRSEAQTLARLDHPNLATVYSLLEEQGELYLVMEFIEGRTLSKLLRERGRIPLVEALPLFFQALDGVGFAHEHGIVHRDVKSSNVMVTARGRVKVMDFGIARAIGSHRVTRLGRMVGTLSYMSPEQVRGDETDARSDIYSLGVLFYDMVAGRVPFARRNDYELMRAHVEAPPPSMRRFAPDLPEALDAVVLRALAKDPDERFATTEAFRRALEPLVPPTAAERRDPGPTQVLAGPDPAARADAEDPTRVDAPAAPARPRRRVRPSVALAALAALVLAGANLLDLERPRQRTVPAPIPAPRDAWQPHPAPGVEPGERAALEALGWFGAPAEVAPPREAAGGSPRAGGPAAAPRRHPAGAAVADETSSSAREDERNSPAGREEEPSAPDQTEPPGWVIRRR